MCDLSGPDLPLVSIIIPVFNGSDWMEVAIDSALAQTYPHIEVIVVNDGSTDDGRTARIAEAYGARIRYIAQPNGGVGAALNTGIAAMRGAYFSWLSHDDVYLPLKIETQMRKMAECADPVVIFGNVSLIDDRSCLIEHVDFAPQIKPGDEPFWCVLGTLLSGCSLLIPKECFETCGTFNPALPTTQDYDLWFRLARRYRFVHTPENLTLSRQHEAQGSRAAPHLDEVTFMFMRFINELPDMLASCPPEDRFAVAARAGRLWMAEAFPPVGLRIERWKSQIRALTKLLVVGPADRFPDGLRACAALEALGYATPDLVFLRAGRDVAVTELAAAELAMRRHGCILSLSEGAGLAELAAAVADIAGPDRIVVFWDTDTFADPQCLAAALDRVMERAADMVFAGGRPSVPSLGRLIARGAALRQQADMGDLAYWASEPVTPLPDAMSPDMPDAETTDASACAVEAAAASEPVVSAVPPILPLLRRGPRYRLPRLLRASTWSAERNRARVHRLRALMTGLGRSGQPQALIAAPLPDADAEQSVLLPSASEAPAPPLAERLILADRSREAADWSRHLDRALKSSVRRLSGHVDADGCLTLSAAGRTTAEKFCLPQQTQAAVDCLRRRGIRRLDVIGADIGPEIGQLIEKLAIPYDVTILAAPHGDALGPEMAVLAKAQRVFAPPGGVAEQVAALAGERALSAALPGAREARAFHVGAPVVRPGERLRVLALSFKRAESGDDDLRRVASLIRETGSPIELSAAGQAGRAAVYPSLHWLGPYDDRRLISYVGAADPHLVWVVLDRDAACAPCLLDAMWTGLPLLVTGSADAAAPVAGRTHTRFISSGSPETVVAWLNTVYAGQARNSDPGPCDDVAAAFSGATYLDGMT